MIASTGYAHGVGTVSAELRAASAPELVYLNNATTSYPKFPGAVRAFQRTLDTPPSDIRHSDLPDIEAARATIAKLLGLERTQTFFSSEATLGLNLVIQGLLVPADHCVVDNRPHNAVTRTLHGLGVDWSMAEVHGVDERPDLDRWESALRPDTKLVCLTHTSNVTGSVYAIQPLIAVTRSRSPDAAVLVDASQSAGAADLDAMRDADFFVFPAHKHLHGLPGAAVVAARHKLRPVFYGGTGTHSSQLSLDHYDSNLVEVGTPNTPAIVALAAALEDWVANRQIYRDHVHRVTRQLWDGLLAIPGVRVLGRPPGPDRTGVVAARVLAGSPEGDWVPFLRSQNVIVRGGLHCCPAYHQGLSLGSQGTLRFSVSRYTSEQDVATALDRVATFSAGMELLHG